MIIQKFKSEHINDYQLIIDEDKNVLSLFLKLNEFRKIFKNFNEVKEEILKNNKAIKDIKQPYIQECYYEEYEGHWLLENPGRDSWWELKKQGHVRNFKLLDIELNDGYRLVLDEEE